MTKTENAVVSPLNHSTQNFTTNVKDQPGELLFCKLQSSHPKINHRTELKS